MTRLRFLLVSFFAAVAAVLGLRRKVAGRWRAKFVIASKPVHPQFGYLVTRRPPQPLAEEPSVSETNFRHRVQSYTIMQKETPKGMIYQWRTSDGVAMSPVFGCKDAAIYYEGPFVPTLVT